MEVASNVLTGKTLGEAVDAALRGDIDDLEAILAGEATAFLVGSTCRAGVIGFTAGFGAVAASGCLAASEAAAYAVEELAN